MIEVLKNKMSKIKKGYTTTRNKSEFDEHPDEMKKQTAGSQNRKMD
jgi:hypothetical protein